MKRFNNKGFMMAELMIASVLLVSTIVGLYAGFNKMYSNYKVRDSYDKAEVLYGAKVIKDFLIDQYKMNVLIKNTNSYLDITSCNDVFTCDNAETSYYNDVKEAYNISSLYFSKYDISDINFNLDNEFIKDYVAYLKKDVTMSSGLYKDGYRIIVETNDKNYASLAVGNIDMSGGNSPSLDKSGANAPVLTNGMIPVMYDGANWVKVNSLNNDLQNLWYDYKNKMWANAVMVSSATRESYLNASVGTVINSADILAYFVWIPRYKYKLFNASFAASSIPDTIDIVFEKGTAKTGTGSSNGTYLTHPAFTFGTDELKGIWVGKFETTGNTSNLTVLPGKVSLKSLNIFTMYSISKDFQSTKYLSEEGINKVDAHILKNIDWGAVAYLSHSLYGKNDEIEQNTNASYYTGGGSGTTYLSKVGQSTTGNVTGIYDMSGGAWEYVVGNYANTTGSSGFVSFQTSKYYDIYGGTSVAYSKRGDALGETAYWYLDSYNFVYSSNPWFVRGYNYTATTAAGIFAFSYTSGGAADSYGFRMVLAIK